MFQKPDISRVDVDNKLQSLVSSEGPCVAAICRLIHEQAGLLSSSPVCTEWDVVLELARTIVSAHASSAHASTVPEAETSTPLSEDMYLGLQLNEGKSRADICRQIYQYCDLGSRSLDSVDWGLLICQANLVRNPFSARDSMAQANVPLSFPGYRFMPDEEE